MSDHERIESEIHSLLTADMTSTEFSNRVFGQFHGLFPQLGTTEADRRLIVQSDLWKRAKARLRDLEKRDLERLRRGAATPEQSVA
jgi:hypothetical protein